MNPFSHGNFTEGLFEIGRGGGGRSSRPWNKGGRSKNKKGPGPPDPSPGSATGKAICLLTLWPKTTQHIFDKLNLLFFIIKMSA